MRLRGGYKVLLAGPPAEQIRVMPAAEELYLPLRAKRFTFSEICVKEGQQVVEGDILAKDLANYAIPLLSPHAGTVRLGAVDGHIVLDNASQSSGQIHTVEVELPHIVQEMGAAGIKRYKLLTLGAWEYFHDAYTGALPDPLGTPQAIIVCTLSLEPFVARGDVQLHERLLNFTRGLEHLQSLLEYQPIYLVMPDIKSDLASQVQEHLRGYAWVKLVEIPLKYPYDNFNILARWLMLKKKSGTVWGIRTEGVLAVEKTLTSMKPCTMRTISVGGPAVNSPVHIEVPTGYPIQKIIDIFASQSPARIINGGIFTGETITADLLGLDSECRGLTILPEHKEREFLGFMRPGWDRHSYRASFLSSARAEFVERLTTAVRGEERPCVSCGYCEEICPAGIMPYLLHKYLYGDLIDEVDKARLDLCIECGLCSYVCPSKIELRNEFITAKQLIAKEKEEVAQAEQCRE
ncbi:MAG: 4Fe-4S dicluster domain-containing protein [Phycisphaerae bacterium]|nr:4Fe-4S dicluster domain-containing protein [Phycisphaerae bacterium]